MYPYRDRAASTQSAGSGGNQGAVSPNISFTDKQPVVPPLNSDGLFKALNVVRIGDTRGNEWYSRCVCISVDPTAIPPQGLDVPIPL
jgi:hypothetical protein